MDLKSEIISEGLLLPRDLTQKIQNSVPNFSSSQENQSCSRTDFLEILAISKPNNYQDEVDTNSTIFKDSPKIEDMQYWILAAFVLIFARILVERCIFIPLGRKLGMKEKPKDQNIFCRIPSAVPKLEKEYLSRKKKFSDKSIEKISLKTGLKPREIQYWLRKRKQLDKPSTLIKFSESGWRFVSYVLSTSIGIWALSDKPWVWDMELLWADYPNHPVSIQTRIYYLYGSGLYLSFLFTQAFDIKRKDFWEMFVHHVVTLVLLGSSWIVNFTRIGLYTLLLHDVADVFLEVTKMTMYTKKKDLSTWTFGIFTIVWIVTRLVIYPINVVIGSTYYMLRLEDFPKEYAYTLSGLLTALFALHVFWTYFICKIAISAVKTGSETPKDARSSTEDSDATNETEIPIASSSNFNKGKVDVVKKEESTFARRLSLQNENAAQILQMINVKQRAIIKRISVEIM